MTEDRYTAFASGRLLASGSPEQAVAAAGAALAADQPGVLIFDDATGEQVEIDPFARSPAIATLAVISPATRATAMTTGWAAASPSFMDRKVGTGSDPQPFGDDRAYPVRLCRLPARGRMLHAAQRRYPYG